MTHMIDYETVPSSPQTKAPVKPGQRPEDEMLVTEKKKYMYAVSENHFYLDSLQCLV